MIGIFRINDIIDLPLIDSITEQKLSTIRDVIVDLRENAVYALVCKEGLFRRSLEAVLFTHVSEISESSIAITGRIDIISLKELSIKHRRFQSYQNVLGKLVLNPHGDTLGVIRDILIDTKSGVIKAYELSDGYIDDLLKGRHIMELDSGRTLIGKNVVLKDYNTQHLLKNRL